jgi:heat shock protein 5
MENYAFNLKSQVNDDNGLGAKIDAQEKQQILEAVKETQDWLDEFGSSAVAEDFEERKQQLSDVAYPITSKLYSDAGQDNGHGMHDEL